MGKIRDWYTGYPIALDDRQDMKTVRNKVHDTRASQINSLRDSIIGIETEVGIDVEIPSVESDPVWNYLSTTQPTGMSTPAIAVWQCDGTANTFTDRTGNGHTLVYNGIGGADEFHEKYFDSLVGFGNAKDCYLTVSSQTNLNLLGAATWEAVVTMNSNEAQTLYNWYSSSSSEDYNSLYYMSFGALPPRVYFGQEHGDPGVTDSDYFKTTYLLGGPNYLAWTRSSASGGYQTIKYFVNGYQAGNSLSLIEPTGGSLGEFRIGYVWPGLFFSGRITDAEFTAAQVLETANGLRA